MEGRKRPFLARLFRFAARPHQDRPALGLCARPAAHLRDFRGVLQVDGYAGFERLTAPGGIVLAACWAHARRKFYDLHEATGSPIAAEALRRIAELYAIESSIRAARESNVGIPVIPAPGRSSR